MAVKAYYLDKRVTKTPTVDGSLANLQNTLNLKTYIQEVVDDSTTDFTSINVDTINESTAAHGVIVDGVTIKDGVVTSTGINTYSTTVGITAFAGGGQASATALTTEYNTIGICATAGDSVKLPTPAVGKLVQVFNGGAADLAVFPVTGGTIGGLSANASITLPPQSVKYFLGVSATAWGLDGRLVAVENGTVAAPSITFDNNSDTGLYYISATQTGFSTGGTLVGGFNSTGLFTDVVSEQTSTVGVTVDGALIKDGSFTGKQATATATADGLTTGLLTGADQFVTVTSANANNIVCLPSDTTCPVGTVIRGWVNANGFELRSLAADTTQTINNVTAGVTNEAAIPATTFFTVTKVASLTWLLTAVDELGAVITAIIPDAV